MIEEEEEEGSTVFFFIIHIKVSCKGIISVQKKVASKKFRTTAKFKGSLAKKEMRGICNGIINQICCYKVK